MFRGLQSREAGGVNYQGFAVSTKGVPLNFTMVNPELMRQLLQELEQEKGGPVQLRLDTPASIQYVDGQDILGREYFGRFEERSIAVKPIPTLEPEYKDSEQFSGNYSSLRELYSRVNDFNQEWQRNHPRELDPRYEVSPEGIFADPISSGWGSHYRKKVADITLKLIE